MVLSRTRDSPFWVTAYGASLMHNGQLWVAGIERITACLRQTPRVLVVEGVLFG